MCEKNKDIYGGLSQLNVVVNRESHNHFYICPGNHIRHVCAKAIGIFLPLAQTSTRRSATHRFNNDKSRKGQRVELELEQPWALL